MPAHAERSAVLLLIIPCALVLAADSLFGRYIAVVLHQNPLVISGVGYLAATGLIIIISRVWISLTKQEPPSILAVIINRYTVIYGFVHILQVATILFQLSLMSAFDATLVARLSIPIFIAQGLILGRRERAGVNLLAVALAGILIAILYASVKREDILIAFASAMVMAILWVVRGAIAQKTPRGETSGLNLYIIGWIQFTGSILFLSLLVMVALSPWAQTSILGDLSINQWFNQDSWWVILLGSGLIWPLVVFYLLRTPQKAPKSFQAMLAFLPAVVLALETAVGYLGIMSVPSHSPVHYAGSLVVLAITLFMFYSNHEHAIKSKQGAG